MGASNLPPSEPPALSANLQRIMASLSSMKIRSVTKLAQLANSVGQVIIVNKNLLKKEGVTSTKVEGETDADGVVLKHNVYHINPMLTQSINLALSDDAIDTHKDVAGYLGFVGNMAAELNRLLVSNIGHYGNNRKMFLLMNNTHNDLITKTMIAIVIQQILARFVMLGGKPENL